MNIQNLILIMLGVVSIILCILILKSKKITLKIILGAVFLLYFFILWDWYFYRFRQHIVGTSKVVAFLFIIIIVCFLVVSIAEYLLFFKAKIKKAEYYFLLSTLGWGIVYMLIMPVFSVPDEGIHFISANKLANQIMGQKAVDETGVVYVRGEENQEFVLYPSKNSLIEHYRKMVDPVGNTNYVAATCHDDYKYGVETSILCYFPQAIGIVIGRLLNLNYFWLSLLGRITNFLFYIFITFWAIKLCPIGKWSMFVITQFPMVLELVSSYSYDTITIAMTFLFCSVCFRFIYTKEKIDLCRFVAVGILGILTVPLKVVYLPILLLVILIPTDKVNVRKSSTYIIKALIIGAGSIIALLPNLSRALNVLKYGYISHISEVEIISEATSEAIATPNNGITELLFKYIGMFINTFQELAEYYFITAIGGKLGWLDINIPNYLICGFIIILLASLFIPNKEGSAINKKHIFVCLFILASSIFAFHFVMLSVATPEGYTYIQGVQGRYFIPLFPVLLPLIYKQSLRWNYVPKEVIWFASTNLLMLLTSFSTYFTILSR